MVIQSNFDKPILFRTTDKTVHDLTVNNGSLWLRTSRYYRELEDRTRSDKHEGVNTSPMKFPLYFKNSNDVKVNLISDGTGSLGTEIIDHYLVSMHGIGITETIRQEFGGHTIGIKDIDRLAAEILFEASKQLEVHGYRYGPVSYQNTALTRSQHANSSIISIGNEGCPEYIKSMPTDVLRKKPIEPFIFQDEWRIAIFTKNIVSNDFNEPLKINVSPENFYEYIA